MPSPAEAGATETSLKRTLTLTHAVLYGLGVTVGAGIYVLIAAAAARAGLYAPISFVLTAALIAFTGASLAELGGRMPVAAGEAAYVRRAFGSERMAAFVGLLVIAVALISAATVSVGAAGYISVFVPAPMPLLITGVALSMGAIAARGIRESVTFAGIMTVIELGGLALVVAAGLVYEPGVISRAPEMLPRTLDPAIWSGIMTASMLAVFAFIGFEGIVNIAEEMKAPQRDLPLAIFLTLLVTTVLYVLVMWVALVSVGVDRLAASSAPLALVFERLTGASPRTMSAIAIVATLNGIVVNIIMASRVMYGLSRQGNLPAFLGDVDPRTRTPLKGTLLSTAIVLAFALLLPIAELADLSARVVLAMFALVNLALYWIKKTETAAPSGIFTVWRWVPLAGVVSCLAFIAADIAINFFSS